MQSIHLLVLLMALSSATCQVLEQDPLEYELLKLADQLEPVDDQRYRLPNSIVPRKYNIKLVPCFSTFTYTGSIEITVEAVETDKKISFHATHQEIDYKSIKVSELAAPYKTIGVTSVERDTEADIYSLNLATALVKNTSYVIAIEKFKGILNDEKVGFYRSKYFVNNTVRWLATTQFEPTHARRAFPCFDEPALKARFTISISRPEGLRAISNMPQKGQPQRDTEHTETTRSWDHFEETPLMSTYLVAFVISDFTYLDEKMRVFAPPPLVQHTRYALAHSKGILDWLADYLDVSYDMPKMDQIAIPDFKAGAMENWGLVTYRITALLVDDADTPSDRKISTAIIIAHEFAHQWFGNLVTPEWWKYLWLNEGFATYFGVFTIAALFPEWRLDERFVVNEQLEAFHIDADLKLHPMTVNVTTPSQVSAIFNGISYDKSASVIRMMQSITTTKSFRKGLHHYLKAKSYSSANPENLFHCLSEQMTKDNVTYEVDFKDVMRSWTLQEGFPVVNVTRDYQDDEGATLSQEQFLYNNQLEDRSSSKWYVPLTYTNQAEADFGSTRPKHWLNPRDQETTRITHLGDNSHWVLFNVQASGYYRVNYDERNWELLTIYLKSADYETIPPVNRAQLLDDAFQLARSHRLPYRVALNLSTYLRQDTDLIAWNGIGYSFNNLARMFTHTPGLATFDKFWKHLREKTVRTFGFYPGDDDDLMTRLGRSEAVKFSCQVGEEECVNLAISEVAKFIHNPERNKIDPDLQEAFYCAAVRYGDRTVFDFFRGHQERCSCPSERVIVIKARGCSEDPELLHSFLSETVASDSTLRSQERKDVFKSVYAHPVGLDVAFKFVVDNFEAVTKALGTSFHVLKTVYKMATLSNSLDHRQLLEKFLRANLEMVQVYAPAIEKAIETIDNNSQWYDKVGKEICQWITEYFDNLISPKPRIVKLI